MKLVQHTNNDESNQRLLNFIMNLDNSSERGNVFTNVSTEDIQYKKVIYIDSILNIKDVYSLTPEDVIILAYDKVVNAMELKALSDIKYKTQCNVLIYADRYLIPEEVLDSYFTVVGEYL